MSQAGSTGSGGGGGAGPVFPNNFPITPYVVGPVGKAGYQTIQSAINAAIPSGGLVFIQNGSYAENLDLHLSVNLWGEGSNLTEIVGVHTPPATGSDGLATQLQGLTLTSSSDIISSTAASSAALSFKDCVFNTTAGGYALNIANWTGPIDVFNCSSSGVDNGFLNCLDGSAVVTVNSSILGTASANTLTTSGAFNLRNSILNCPSAFSGLTTFFGSAVNQALQTLSDFEFDTCMFYQTVSASDIVLGGPFNNCYFLSQTSVAYEMNANGTLVEFNNCIFDSQIHPVITGSGSTPLQFTSCSFIEESTVDPALVVQYGTSLTGAMETRGGRAIKVTVVTNALSPYSVGQTDEFISCDGVGGAITVSLPNGSFWPVSGTRIEVCDSTGHAAADNITIDGIGKDISYAGASAATLVMTTPYQLVNLTYNGSSWNAV